MQYYQQLAGLLTRLKVVLSEDRGTELASLLREYTMIMAALSQTTAGDGGADLALLTSLRQDVSALLAIAEQQQDALRQQLTQMGRQRRQMVAYTKAQTL
jgi:hypothetical protein